MPQSSKTLRCAAFVLSCGSLSLGAAACGGTAVAPPAQTRSAFTVLPARAPHATGNVTLSLTIPFSGQLPCSQDGFISPYTSTLRITVNGSKLPAVRVKAQGRFSTTFSAPAGSDRILVALDVAHAAISQAAFAVRVTSGRTTSVRPTFEGIVASGSFTTTDANPQAGHASTIAVKFDATDATDDTICGSYASPVDVEMLGGKPAVTPLTASFSKQRQTLNFTYDGKLGNPSFSLHAASLKSVRDLEFRIDPYTFTSKSKGVIRDIVAGKNDDVWFSDCEGRRGCRIGNVSANGTMTESKPVAPMQSIALGPDGNVWFAEGTIVGNPGGFGRFAKVGKLNPATGRVTIYSIDSPQPQPDVQDIVLGPDGRLWFNNGGSIGNIATDGTVHQYHTEDFGGDVQLVPGPDGRLYYEGYSNRAGVTPFCAIDTSGKTTCYRKKGDAGFDLRVWYHDKLFAEVGGTSIVAFTTNGAMSKIFTHRSGDVPIARGPNDTLWGASTEGNAGISRLYLSGSTLTSVDYPETQKESFLINNFEKIVEATDGSLWIYGEGGDGNRLAHFPAGDL